MATMENIRKMSPFMLGFIAVLFIVFMVISDADVPTILGQSNYQSEFIGEVNGEMIKRTEFDKRVRSQVENQRNQTGGEVDIDEGPIREQIWTQMVDEILMRQAAEQLGVTVTDEEIRDVMFNNPPDFIQNQFKDSSGAFNRQAYVDLISNPQSLENRVSREAYRDFLEYLINIEDYLRTTRLRENLQTAVGAASSIVSPEYVKRQYELSNSFADVSYIALRTSAIADDKVEISEEEIEAHYQKTKKKYPQEPSRELKYIALKIVPSSLDSSRSQRRVEKLRNALNQAATPASRDSLFNLYTIEYAGEKHDFTLIKDIDPQRLSYLTSLEKRQVAGPVVLNDGTYFFRLDDTRSGTNEVVKASHILLKENTPDDADSVKALADDLYKRALKGEDFAELAREYSTDQGSARQGGDVGYFGPGKMVKEFEEAAYDAEIGEITKPVKTQFGYHIIKVTDKKSDEIAYSEIKITPRISNGTRSSVFRDAKSFQYLVEQGDNFDTVAARNGYTVRTTGQFPKTNPVLGSRLLSGQAFSANVGDLLEPLEVKPTGVVVALVSDARTRGYKPLDDVREQVRGELVESKKLDIILPQAEQIYASLRSLSSLEEANGQDVKIASSIKDDGNVSGYGRDYAFTSQAFSLPVNEISVPVRGEKAYFIMQVTNRTAADMAKFDAEKTTQMQTQARTFRQSAFYQWLTEVKKEAVIVDNRSTYYRN